MSITITPFNIASKIHPYLDDRPYLDVLLRWYNKGMKKIPEGWVEKDGRLVLMIKGADFMRTLALLNAVGDIAESHNHHPDLALRNYNELIISTTTHDVGGLTEKDYKLAQEITGLISYQEKKRHIEQHGRQ